MSRAGRRPSEVFRSRLAEVRKRRGWSQQDLADRLGEIGISVDRATLTRTEAGDRGVSLDDALAYSAVLGASVVNMVTPLSDEPVELAPKFVVPSRAVRRWVRGQGALRQEDQATYFAEASDEEWAARTDVTLAYFLSKAQEMVDAAAAGHREREADLIDELNDLLKHLKRALRAQLDEKGR